VAANVTKVRWGVLGVAKIATRQVIPAMQRGQRSEVVAIASRDESKARAAAAEFGVAAAYGSYEALLADPGVEAIYNPLPNHLHLPWSIKALEAGKHVLCEKPIGLGVGEVEELRRARDRTGLLVQEAFMVRTHPQWLAAIDLVRSGRIGELRSISGYFSYFNRDAANIRNVAEYGGGGIMDIGCYLTNTARLIFGAEPIRVVSTIDHDPDLGVDRLASLILEFERGHAIGTCSTQAVAYQRVQIVGSTGRIEIEIPFNAPPDRPCRILVDDGRDVFGTGTETITLPTCDQYTIQGDLFSRAIREGGPVAYPLEDTIANMKVIEAVFRSGKTRGWEEP
jgi:predicted dehydrogenase